jgi:hypothetical protein
MTMQINDLLKEGPRRLFRELENLLGRSASDLLAQADYWLSKSKHVISGERWFWKTYESWSDELNSSVPTVRRAVGKLRCLGIFIVERKSAETWYQANWYTINFAKLTSYLAKFNQLNLKIYLAVFEKFKVLQPYIDQMHPIAAIASNESKRSLHCIDSTSKDSSSIFPEEEEKKNAGDFKDNGHAENQQQDFGKAEFDCHEDSFAPPKQENSRKPKPQGYLNTEVWEIAPGRPYPVFLNWWASHKYKPQGGHWERDALGNAYAEFYNNRNKTTVAIFPQFLEYMQTAAEVANQCQVNDMQAALPSCFVLKPEASQENVQVLMGNISTLVERGAAVALPAESATPSCRQALSFEEAEDKSAIHPLAELKAIAAVPRASRKKLFQQKPEKVTVLDQDLDSLLEITDSPPNFDSCTVEIKELNEWLLNTNLANQAEKIAISRGYALTRDSRNRVIYISKRIENESSESSNAEAVQEAKLSGRNLPPDRLRAKSVGTNPLSEELCADWDAIALQNEQWEKQFSCFPDIWGGD